MKTITLTEQQFRDLGIFLGRTTLKGTEHPRFHSLLTAIRRFKEVKPAEPGSPSSVPDQDTAAAADGGETASPKIRPG